jgi:hypothetical protein
MMADIFVSYARAERNLVADIVNLLEAQGWSVWWDTRLDASVSGTSRPRALEMASNAEFA